jgi:hypothetical protein
MGSNHSLSKSTSIDELNNNATTSKSSSNSSVKSKKSSTAVRLINKIRRQTSTQESIARQQKLCQQFIAIDPVSTSSSMQNAQDLTRGEFATIQDETADIGM